MSMGLTLPCRRLALASLFVALAGPLNAARPSAVDAEGAIHSMFVHGSIDVGPDGRVQRYAIDNAEAYTPAIRAMLERVIPEWTFRTPEEGGVPHAVHSAMFLRLQANPADDGQFRVDIASAAFGGGSGAKAAASDKLASREMKPPRYPRDEIRAGIGAQLVAAVRVARDGSVEDVVIEQTNLTRIGTERAMARWRRDFEQEALAAMAQWRFAPPTTGSEAGRSSWSVRIPVVYTPGSEAQTAGRWQNFVPGPRHPVPWASEEEMATATDALPDGGIFPMKPELRLLTPLHQG
jgi:TonB family protein